MRDETIKFLEAFKTSKLGYDSFISHNDFDYMAGLKRPDLLEAHSNTHAIKMHEKWRRDRVAIVEEVKKVLLIEYQMNLASIIGEGYRILKPAEQTESAMRDVASRVTSAIKKGVRILDNVNREMLTDVQRAENDIAKARLAGFALMARKKNFLPAAIKKRRTDESAK